MIGPDVTDTALSEFIISASCGLSVSRKGTGQSPSRLMAEADLALYRAKAETPGILLLGSLAGLGFALYLTYIEGFVLGTWCVLCLSSLAMITAIAALSGLQFWRSAREEGRRSQVAGDS